MTEITVSKFEGELRADSRTFAPKMDIRHRQLMDNIRKYKDKFDQLGFLPFETEEIDGRGQPEKYALLNEDQAYFMLTLSRNTDAVVSAKLAGYITWSWWIVTLPLWGGVALIFSLLIIGPVLTIVGAFILDVLNGLTKSKNK
jgi:hypothetical protein